MIGCRPNGCYPHKRDRGGLEVERGEGGGLAVSDILPPPSFAISPLFPFPTCNMELELVQTHMTAS